MLKCPSCRNIYLRPYKDRESGFVVNSCPVCFGIWFGRGEAAEFVRSRHLVDRFIFPDVIQVEEYNISTVGRVCPQCQIELEDRLFSDALACICCRCKGTWLDFGEARRIFERYRKGEDMEILKMHEVAHEIVPEGKSGIDYYKPRGCLDYLISFLQYLKDRRQ